MENIRMNLRLFDANTQVTTQQSLTEEMKTFYSDYLIDAAEPELVHDQFAQKHPIPANGGKTIQFRRFAPLGKALTALTEGVTPDGQSLSMTTVEAAVRQYGGYIQMSDMLLLTAIDNNLTMATKLLGAQAGRTLDTITREVLVGGDNVQYADESVSARYLLQGGNASAADNNYLTVDCIRRAVRALKNAKARRETGLFLVEGETMLNEALSSGLVPRALLAEAETPLAARFPEARLVTRGVLEAVCDTKTPQGMCAAFELPPPRALSDAPRTLVALDGVQDPGNVGTIWRTADAAGFSGLLLGEGSADPLSPKVLRAAMGSGFRLPFLRGEPLERALAALSARGYAIVASALDGIPNIGEVRKRKLLARFKSVKAIREAELPALQSELGRAAGRAVYDHFHPKEETP